MNDPKNFILDTNVFIYDPDAIEKFEENNVYVPIVVLEELDSLKVRPGEVGYMARRSIRSIEKARAGGNLQDGAQLPGGGKLKIITENIDFNFRYMLKSADNYIIGTARRLEDIQGQKFIIVSRDVGLRLKAEAFGIEVQDYRSDKIDGIDAVGKITKVLTSDENIDRVYRGELIDVLPYDGFDGNPIENGCYILVAMDGAKSALTRYRCGRYVPIGKGHKVCGIKPRNAEQRFLMDALLDRDIKLVVCSGVAGAGKTLLSLAAGVEQCDKCNYNRLMITKTIEPVGRDIGYLPGSKGEKMAEWIKPYRDNLEILLDSYGGMLDVDRTFAELIEVEALTFMRGRSLMDRYIIYDECQNISAGNIKTVVSRVHDSSKLVLLGDISQIDHQFLTRENNGLAHAMKNLSGLPGVVVMNLQKGERGALATLAVNRL